MLYLVLTARASVGFKHQALSLFEKRLFSAMNVCISGFDVDWHTGWDYVCPSFSLHSVCAVLRIRDRYWKNRPTLCHNGPTIFVLSFPTLSSCSLSPCWWWWWSLSSSPLPLAQRDVLELKLDGRLYTFCCRLAVAFPFSSANFLYFFSPPLYKLSPHRTASSISFMLFIWLDFITSPIASDLCIRRWFLERLLHYMYLAVSPMPFSLPSFFFGFVWGGEGRRGLCTLPPSTLHAHLEDCLILTTIWWYFQWKFLQGGSSSVETTPSQALTGWICFLFPHFPYSGAFFSILSLCSFGFFFFSCLCACSNKLSVFFVFPWFSHVVPCFDHTLRGSCLGSERVLFEE
jgi:hypothetical protein